MSRTRHPDRGAIIVHVAISLLALLAFSAFVVDYGVMWVSRRQAQNAADAAAHAAAVAMTFDLAPGLATPGRLKDAADTYAAQNVIWGIAPAPADIDVVSTFDDPPFPCPSNVTGSNCVRVDVFRGTPGRTGTGTRGTVLPAFFANLVGLASQGVRATATAQSANGGVSRCIKPWAVADRWDDNWDNQGAGQFFQDNIWTVEDWYQGPNEVGPTGQEAGATNDVGPDIYIHPYSPASTGFTVETDFGRQLVLKGSKPGEGHLFGGWTQKLNLPGGNGAADYREDISGCDPTEVSIASETETCAGGPDLAIGCGDVDTGNTVGPTRQGVDDLVAQDSGAHWENGDIVGSSYTGLSPRVVPVVIFDPLIYVTQNCHGGTQCTVKIVNIIGFFVEGMCSDVEDAGGLDPDVDAGECGNSDVIGRIYAYPTFSIGNNAVDPVSSFLRVIRLVR
jgi:hypothetical protein